MTEPLLVIDNLEVAYHRVAVALHGVSLKVMPQTIVALVGNNGAGKTTTLRAVSGFIGLDDARVTAGSIRFAGQDIANEPPHANTASLGLAPVVVEDLARRIASIRQELRITVLLVEQNVGVALGIADYGYVLENGRVALEGPAAELRGRREIQQSYLGQASGEERRSYRALKQEHPHG